MSHLQAALTALQGGDRQVALQHLVRAWLEQPVPAVADLVAALDEGAYVLQAHPKGLQARRSMDVANRLETLVNLGPDPRLGVALEGVLRAVPFTANSSRAAWKGIFDMVRHVGQVDPRFAGIQATLTEDWAVREAQSKWMHRAFARDAAADVDAAWADGVPTLSAAEQAHLDALVVLVHPPEKTTPRQRTIEQLYDAVYADPGDDSVRLVLMDALLEKGDPRGEFLALQLQDGDPFRQKALLYKHGQDWLGPLAVVEELVWERGFPVAGNVTFDQPRDLARIAEDPRWATFERLEVRGWSVDAETARRFFQHIARTVRVLGPLSHEMLEGFLGVEGPVAVEDLRVSLRRMDEGHRLADLPGLTKLRAIDVQWGELAWLRDAHWWPGLQTVSHSLGFRGLVAAWRTFAEHEGVQRVAGQRWTFERGEDGFLSVLRVDAVESLGKAVIDEDGVTARRRFRENGRQLPPTALTELIVAGRDWDEFWAEDTERVANEQQRLRVVQTPDGRQEHDVAEVERVVTVAEAPTPGNVVDGHWNEQGIAVVDGTHLFRIDADAGTIVEWGRCGGPRGVSAHGDRVATAAGGLLMLWRWGALEGRPELERHVDASSRVRFSPDGSLLAVGSEPVRVLDAASLDEVRRYNSAASDLAWSPDGQTLAVAAGGAVALVPARSGRARKLKLVGYPMGLSYAQTLLISTFSGWQEWDPDAREVLRTETSSVGHIRHAPGGRLLITRHEERWGLYVYDADGTEVASFPTRISRIVLSPDGRRVLTSVRPITVVDLPG